MNTVRILSLLALVCLSSGCFRYGVSSSVPNDGVQRMQKGPVFAWGLVGQEKLAEECPNGVARSESYMPWWGGLVMGLTIGIVTPWRVEYVCAAGGAPGVGAPVISDGLDTTAPAPTEPTSPDGL